MNKGLHLFICFFWLALNGYEAFAQLACGYQFQFVTGVDYVPLPPNPPSVTLANGAENPIDPFSSSPTDENFWTNQAIGFPFLFNGNLYTSCGITTNGWIWFGPQVPVKAAGVLIPFTQVLAGDADMQGIISALNADLKGRWSGGELATIRTRTAGTAPHRTFTVEWNNFTANDPGQGAGYCGASRNRFDFQIILFEHQGRIEFAYRAEEYCHQGYEQLFQVGLRGASKADVHSRSIVAEQQAWAKSTLGFNLSTAIIRSSSPRSVPLTKSRFVFFPGEAPVLRWQGKNTNWFDPANWLPQQVPMRCNDVIIEGNKRNFPELSGNRQAHCKSLTIQAGAALTLKNNYSSFLSIFGNLINNGVVVNNANQFISLCGGENVSIMGNGSFIGTDIFVTRNSTYQLQNDIALRSLFINEGSALRIGQSVLNVFSLVQHGALFQEQGLLIVEGDAPSVVMTDSTFHAGSGTTFFGNGEIWLQQSGQTVPSLTYNHLWVRTNKHQTVTIGTQGDVRCNNLLFYNPGEAGGVAETASNILVSGHLKLGIAGQQGTELKLNHQIIKSQPSGSLQMGQQDHIQVLSLSQQASEAAIVGFENPYFEGEVSYEQNGAQRIVPGTYEKLTIKGNGQRYLTDSVKIKGVLRVEDGVLHTQNQLRLVADSSRTGMISGSGQGEVLGQVWIESWAGLGAQNSLLYSAPFEQLQMNQVQGIQATGQHGINWSQETTAANAWEYAESLSSSANYRLGFTSFTNGNETLRQGKAYVLPTSHAKVLAGGQIVRGIKSVALSTSPSTSGFNLIGNPYPSPMHWHNILTTAENKIAGVLYKAGKGNAFQGRYAAYLPMGNGKGFAVNGGSPFIQVAEGFFVKAMVNDTLQFNHTHRIDLQAHEVIAETPAGIDYLRLRISQGNKADETLLYHQTSASKLELNAAVDAEKLIPPSPSFGISIIKGVKKAAIASWPILQQRDTIPLHISIAQTDYYAIKLAEIAGHGVTTLVYLYDAMLNTNTDLRTQSAANLYLTAGEHPQRFFLCLVEGVKVNTLKESCAGKDGLINLSNQSGQNWHIKISNAADSIVFQQNAFQGNAIIHGLAGGDYRIEYQHPLTDLLTEEYVTVQMSNAVKADLHLSASVAAPEASIIFTALAENAQQYFWDFGDGLVLNGGAVQTHAYAEPGQYRVMLTVTRQECSDTISALVHIDPVATSIDELPKDYSSFTVFPNPVSSIATVSLQLSAPEDLQMSLTDAGGKIVLQRQYVKVQPGQSIEIDVSSVANGTYIAVITGVTSKSVSRLIVRK